MAVVPADGAKEQLLGPGAEVFQSASHQKAPQKGQPLSPVPVAVQRNGQNQSTGAIDHIKGPIHQPRPALNVAIGQQAPQQLNHHTAEATDKAYQQKLIQIHAGGEVAAAGLLQIDDGVGRCLQSGMVLPGQVVPAGGEFIVVFQ